MPVRFKLDFSCWKAAITALWLAAALSAAPAETAPTPVEPPLPAFRQLPAMAGVKVAAKAAGLALDGIAVPVNREKMQPGDSAVFLANLTDGKKLTQWVVALRAEAPTEQERAGGGKDQLLYSNTGHTFKFSENKAVVRITVLGPFKAPDQQKADSKQKRVVVTEEFLALGLNGLPAFGLKMKAMQANPEAKGKTVNVNVTTKPFPEGQIATNRETAALFGITESDERALAGTVPALGQFFSLIMATPGLSDMLKSVIDLPIWSILSRGTKSSIDLKTIPFEKEIAGDRWALPFVAKIYALPLELRINDKPSLLCQLAVIDPRPPFQTSAGVIGLAAGAPDGKGPVLTLQLVATSAAVDAAPVAP